IQQGLFSEGFFYLVLYSDEVDSRKGKLKRVFIYDERESGMPVTVIAQEGHVVEADPQFRGKGVTLRLINGNIHSSGEKNYTKIDFQSYGINLLNTATEQIREKSPPSLTFDDLRAAMKDRTKTVEERRVVSAEFHKRWAIAAACLLFGVLGVGAGTNTNRRAVRASGLVVSLVIMVCYWILYISGESMARSGTLPAWLAMWIANILFGAASIYTVKRSW
ncbi:MAG: LptF/LptG family permease, partial [Oligoflexia bacterium]|nr:LptF/LptG family permease [Oligoflexia bacterium]